MQAARLPGCIQHEPSPAGELQAQQLGLTNNGSTTALHALCPTPLPHTG